MKDEPIRKLSGPPICSSVICSSFIILLAAAFVNISPMLLRHVGADIMVYLVWMRCFAEQFWQGDLYPRWCFDVNAGLGAPVFLFYFPLPFYIAALFYPLILLGFSYYSLFILLCFCAGLFAAISCFSWLRDIVTPPAALLASILFLFLPYHLEMVFFRGAYAEIWCVGLLPLLFKYTRRMARGEGGALLPLAFVTGLALLAHVPVAAEALLFSGVYMLAMGATWKSKKGYALAVAWGIAMAAFYLVPGLYYHRFLATSSLASGLYGWPNNYLTLELLKIQGLDRPLMAAGLGILVFTGVALGVMLKRRRVADAFIRREMLVWTGISIAALILLIPVSAPLYALIGPLAKLLFPWRMQMIVMLGVTYLLAVWMQWQIPPGRLKTWKTDFALAIFFLWVAGNALVSSFSPKGDALNEQIEAAKIVFAPEYRSLWTDEDHWNYQTLLDRRERDIPNAAFVSGDGSVKVTQWDWSGFELEVNAKKPATLRLNHFYFPLWQAKLYKGGVPRLYPEARTGLMLLDIPGGEHRIRIATDITDGQQPGLLISQWLSILAFAALAMAFLRVKFFDKSGGDC